MMMRRIAEYLVLAVIAALTFAGCEKDDSGFDWGEQEKGVAGSFVGTIGESSVITPDAMISDIGKLFDGIVSPSVSGILEAVLLKPVVTRSVVITKIEYLTESPTGGLTTASGVIVYPADVEENGSYDQIVSVAHGTCCIDEAPSLQKFCIELVPVFKENVDNVVVMADYLGYGSSQTEDLQHPYLHSYYTGTACADLIRAAESYMKYQKGMKCAGTTPITLIGYSQGGQGSISTLYELQNRGETERVKEIWAGAGPYNLLTLLDEFKKKKDVDYTRCGFIPYMIRGLLYGEQIDMDLHNLLAPEVFLPGPSGRRLCELFSTTMVDSWHVPLGYDVTKVLHPDFFKPEDEMNDDVRKFLNITRKNSVTECGVPVHPERIILFHETDDEQVPYAVSEEASRLWGCSLVRLEIKDNFHIYGAIEMYLRYLGEDRWNAVKPYAALLPDTDFYGFN